MDGAEERSDGACAGDRAATSRIDIVATLTTSFYPPFIAARLAARSHQRRRVGLNIATAHNSRSAQNFGLDQHYEHDLRYEMADEWMDVAYKLWASWENGAVVADRATGVFAVRSISAAC